MYTHYYYYVYMCVYRYVYIYTHTPITPLQWSDGGRYGMGMYG